MEGKMDEPRFIEILGLEQVHKLQEAICDFTGCSVLISDEKTDGTEPYIYEKADGGFGFVVPLRKNDAVVGRISSCDELSKDVASSKRLSYEECNRLAVFIDRVAALLMEQAVNKYESRQNSIEMERENHMKSDFLANMSHEIRTPMNSVCGMAEMALREDLPESARGYIEQIQIASHSLLEIINDILDFSKIEASKMDINLSEYNLVSVIDDVSSIMMARIGTKNLDLLLDVNPFLPKRLMGDCDRIKQVIMNLMDNGVKFTRQGRVRLSVDFEPISDRQMKLMVSVEDTGIGIKEQDKDKLFHSFEQVDSKRNRNVEGAGLGLAISKRLVELMDGEIHVESTFGQGSCFSFSIPQIVVDGDPAILVDETKTIVAGIMTDNENIYEELELDLHRFHVTTKQILLINDLPSLVSDKADFLFVDQSMFSKSVQEFLKTDGADIKTIVMVGQGTLPEYSISNIMRVRKPLYSATIGRILMGYPLTRELDDERAGFDFVAPEAEVLIVDDNEINLAVAEGLMAPLQMQIDTVLGGRECLDKITSKHYDLIFMDHMMPEIDGVETTHMIRRFYPDYDTVPIIALTANAMEESKSMFLVEGMNDFIMKPIDTRVMIDKIRQWLPKDKLHRISDVEKASILESLDEPMEDSFLDELKSAGILDVATALQRLGSEKLYLTVLRDYYRVIDQKINAITEALEENDWRAYEIEVHALKSSSRQIGADDLSDLAALLEKAAKDRDLAFMLVHTKKAIDMYLEVKGLLAEFDLEEAEEEPHQDKKEADSSDLEIIFKEMREASEELDMDALEESFQALNQYKYPVEQGEIYQKLGKAVSGMNVDEVSILLEEWENLL